MKTSALSISDGKRREQASRLIELAIDMLDTDPEQIVRDYLAHALSALERVRDADHAETSPA